MMMSNAPDAGSPPDGHPPIPSPTNQSAFTHGVITLDDHVNTLYDTLLHVEVHRSFKEITDYPLKPFLYDFLQDLKKVNQQNTILLIDPKSLLGAITMEGDIPMGEKLSKYVDGVSVPNNKHVNNDNSNTIRFHICISTTLPLWQLKCNTFLYEWLTKSKIFLHTHGFTMTYDILSAGFLSNLSPTMHHCNMMKMLIDDAA